MLGRNEGIGQAVDKMRKNAGQRAGREEAESTKGTPGRLQKTLEESESKGLQVLKTEWGEAQWTNMFVI